MTISEKDLPVLKQRLIDEMERLRKELDYFAKPTSTKDDYETEFNEIGSDVEDNASEVEEYVDNVALEANLEKQLAEIKKALDGMEEGRYGKCVKCGSDIELERLKAYPAAETCIRCANE